MKYNFPTELFTVFLSVHHSYCPFFQRESRQKIFLFKRGLLLYLSWNKFQFFSNLSMQVLTDPKDYWFLSIQLGEEN